jgi:hypothetical protein
LRIERCAKSTCFPFNRCGESAWRHLARSLPPFEVSEKTDYSLPAGQAIDDCSGKQRPHHKQGAEAALTP